jgi:phenylacetate-CoA ligase
MFVVRGENVYPRAIEDVIRAIPGFGDEYRVIITREKIMDELIVQAELVQGVTSEEAPRLKKQLEIELQSKGLRTVVQLLDPGTLERTQFKAKRIIDQRELYESISGKR